jgi:DNA polymerase-3 subunit beta
VPAKALYDIAKALPELTCRLKAGANNRLEVSSGQSTFRVVGMNAEDFPTLLVKEPKQMTTLPKDFGMVLEEVAYAASTDETRYNLNGVFFDSNDGKLALVATDGHRLSMTTTDLELVGLDRGQILGSRAVSQLLKMLDEESAALSEMAFCDGSLVFRRAGLTFSARLVDGQFPDYRQVIPDVSEAGVAHFDKRVMIEALRRVMLTAGIPPTVQVSCEPEKAIQLTSRNPDLGDSSDSVQAEFTGNAIKVSLNAAYLVEALSALPEGKVMMSVSDDTSPIVIRSTEKAMPTAILMPMRA